MVRMSNRLFMKLCTLGSDVQPQSHARGGATFSKVLLHQLPKSNIGNLFMALVVVGSNDLDQGHSVEDVFWSICQLVQQFDTVTRVLVPQVLPRPNRDAYNRKVFELNGLVKAWAGAPNFRFIHLRGFNPNNLSLWADAVHLSDQGRNRMENQILCAIQSLLPAN